MYLIVLIIGIGLLYIVGKVINDFVEKSESLDDEPFEDNWFNEQEI